MPGQVPAKQQPSERNTSVFLNLSYDTAYQDLFLAYIAGVSVLGLTPRAALEDSSSTRRLDRIHRLLQGCAYSIHDLSLLKLQVDPRRPRFNMPFELGLAVAQDVQCSQTHIWRIFVNDLQRFKGSLSDLDGTDVQIHDGTPTGVFAKLMNVISSPEAQPTVGQMQNTYQLLRENLSSVLEKTGAATIFEASVFRQLSALARSWGSAFAEDAAYQQQLGRKTTR